MCVRVRVECVRVCVCGGEGGVCEGKGMCV